MDGQQAVIYQPEIRPHIVPQREISQVPVVLQWPSVFIPMNCIPVTLSPQTMIALWDPCQPVTIPCLLPNVVLQPRITTAPPVLPTQVLVSSICFQGPANVNQTPINSTQITEVPNQSPAICTQLPDASNPVPELCTQVPDASNQVPKVCTQLSDTSNPVPEVCTQLPDASNPVPEVCAQLPETSIPVPKVCTQLPGISNQGALSAEVDRQKVLDAAEALLILHNSPQVWQETSSVPGPDGE